MSNTGSSSKLITLPKTRFLYLAFALFAVLLVSAIVFVGSSGYASASCLQYEMPAHERTFGFKFGPLEVGAPDGARNTREGIVWVDPAGPFARAGVRVGDVPRVYHGLADFCSDLSVAATGHEVQVTLFNVRQLPNELRTVTIVLK